MLNNAMIATCSPGCRETLGLFERKLEFGPSTVPLEDLGDLFD
jgi:hypothetical protein